MQFWSAVWGMLSAMLPVAIGFSLIAPIPYIIAERLRPARATPSRWQSYVLNTLIGISDADPIRAHRNGSRDAGWSVPFGAWLATARYPVRCLWLGGEGRATGGAAADPARSVVLLVASAGT